MLTISGVDMMCVRLPALAPALFWARGSRERSRCTLCWLCCKIITEKLAEHVKAIRVCHCGEPVIYAEHGTYGISGGPAVALGKSSTHIEL